MNPADAVIQWLYTAENDSGGIAAWKSRSGFYKSYPEVTGYLIPTLLEYGQMELALRCAEWLISVQNEDGSFNGLDDIPRTFDTSAVYQGLRAMKYSTQATAAKRWLKKQKLDSGHLRTHPGTEAPRLYNLRASQIIGGDLSLLPPIPYTQERTHYLGYALEGMWRAGMTEEVRVELELAKDATGASGLMFANVIPGFRGGIGSDTCATAQFAMLYGWAGDHKTGERLLLAVERMIESNGGIRHDLEDERQVAWAAKFYLDALKANA